MSNINLEETINLQPTENIIILGHVSNGKSSLVETLTETNTQRHSREKQKNLTINLGYANAKIFKCGTCEPPLCYQSFPSNKMIACCNVCGNQMKLEKHVSFVDCPGHDELMSIMLNGTCVANYTIIVEAANNSMIPSHQTIGHLNAANILQLTNALVCINKVDLVTESVLVTKMNHLKKALIGTTAENSPIVPIIANFGINKDIVCEYICTRTVEDKKDLESNAKMIIIRSFNVNKPNTPIKHIKGGVIGGSIMKGVLKVGAKILVLPGTFSCIETNDGTGDNKPTKIKKNSGKNGKKTKNKNQQTNKWSYTPITSYVESINSENNKLEYAIPGGLIGVGLTIDPCLTIKDGLIGCVLHEIRNDEPHNYKIFERIFIGINLLDEKDLLDIEGSELIINHNGCDIKCKVIRCRYSKNHNCNAAELELIDRPICSEIGDYISICKIVANGNAYLSCKDKIRLIGRGNILDGIECVLIK